MKKSKEQIVADALHNFEDKFSCSQSVVMAFAEEFGFEKKQVAAVAAGFGSGLGDTHSVCGAFSGAAMSLGLHLAGNEPDGKGVKPPIYAKVRELKANFKSEIGSEICGDIIKAAAGTGVPKRERCAHCVGVAAALCYDALEE